MKTIHYMVLKQFLPIFFFSLFFFILLLELIDLFGNLWRFLQEGVQLNQIMYVYYLYLPKCISFSLPISLIFSVSYTLGTFYSNNELLAIFSSGVSLYMLVIPFVVLGIFFTIFQFYFEETIVIESFDSKNKISNQLLGIKSSLNNTNVTILSANHNIIYHVDYYNDTSKSLSGVLILERTESGSFERRIDCEWANWQNDHWILNNCRVFEWDSTQEVLFEQFKTKIDSPIYAEKPKTFTKMIQEIDQMKIVDAKEWIMTLRKSGLTAELRKALTEYYERYAFACTPLLVVLLSATLGGRFKKNILLMSLLTSLVLSVLYYVTQMLSVLFAKLGYIPPLSGAWAGVFIFLMLTVFLFKVAKT